MQYKKKDRLLSCFFSFIKTPGLLLLLVTSLAGEQAAARACFFAAATQKKQAFTDSAVKTYLALGDSYTIGQSIDSSERFPAQTAAILKRYGILIPSIDYIATTGWKTVNLQWAIEAQRKKRVYDYVTLLIGVNDQYQKRDTIGYREHFINLLEKAIAFAGNRPDHVFVLSIPDYSVTPFGRSRDVSGKQIDEYNAINKSAALSYNITYTDITGISRYDAIDSTMLAFDDMHPSGKQYAQWAQALATKMLRVYE